MPISSRSHVPLGLIFLSGLGFSIQSLFIKILSESGFSGSFQLLFLRGVCQIFVSSIFIYRNVLKGERIKLFGNNSASIVLLAMSSILAYAGQALVFTSIEYVPVDFALVLDRQSVVFQAMLAYFLLGEPWLLIEIIATAISILGVVLIAQPVFFANLFSAISLHMGVISSDSTETSDSNSNSEDGGNGDSGPSGNGFGLDEGAMTLSQGEKLSRAGIVYGLLAAFLTACAYVTIRMTGPRKVRRGSKKSLCSMLMPSADTSIPCPNVVFAASISQLMLSIPCVLLSSKEEFNLALSYSGWALLIGVAVIGTWSQLALTAGLQLEKASRTGVIRTSNVICGILWQTISTGNSPDGLTVTGVILVVIGSLLILVEKNSNDVVHVACRNCLCLCCAASVDYCSARRKSCCCHCCSKIMDSKKNKGEIYLELGMTDDSLHGCESGNCLEPATANNM